MSAKASRILDLKGTTKVDELQMEDVVKGAALQAAILSGNEEGLLKKLFLFPLSNYEISLMVGTKDPVPIIHEQFTLPTKKSINIHVEKNESISVIVATKGLCSKEIFHLGNLPAEMYGGKLIFSIYLDLNGFASLIVEETGGIVVKKELSWDWIFS